MKLSQAGLDLIKDFEGYHRALPDGSCVAYRCPANVLTIGYGCTEGVHEGMRWTKADAEARLLGELTKHETAVARMTTIDLTQNQFDALVSFSYNLGTGALQNSTLLKRVNAGAFEDAGREFARWSKAAGKVLPGLVARRGREAALFLEPPHVAAEPTMPQKVDVPNDEPRPLVKSGTIWGALAAGGTAVASFFEQAVSAGAEWIGALTDMAPLQAAAQQAGGNVKAITLGCSVSAALIVISRRVKAAQEGRAG